MTVFNVSNDREFKAALTSAKAGDVIALAAGTYGEIGIRNAHYVDAPLTIVSQDPRQPAILTEFWTRDSSGIVLKDVNVSVPPAEQTWAEYAVNITLSKNITIDNVHFIGQTPGGQRNDNGGLFVRQSTDVVVKNSEFEKTQFGVMHSDNVNIKIVANYFHDLRHDAIRGAGGTGIEIVGNYIRDMRPLAGDHADGIQFWTARVTSVTSDVKIVGNVIVRGDGAPFQGIFLRDESGAGYRNVEIRDNLVVGTLWHGISLGNDLANGTRSSTSFAETIVVGNRVYAMPDQLTWIRTPDASMVQGNITPRYVIPGVSNAVDQRNVVKDGGAAALEQWLTDVGGTVPRLADELQDLATERTAEQEVTVVEVCGTPSQGAEAPATGEVEVVERWMQRAETDRQDGETLRRAHVASDTEDTGSKEPAVGGEASGATPPSANDVWFANFLHGFASAAESRTFTAGASVEGDATWGVLGGNDLAVPGLSSWELA